MILCEYGCGLEATHQFSNGKWCCSKSSNSCPMVREKRSHSSKGRISAMKGKKVPPLINYFGTELCCYGCGQKANYQFKNGKLCCSRSRNSCSIMKQKNRESLLGEKNHMYGKHHTKESNEKNRISNTGKKQSKETIEKKRISSLGEKNHMYGKKITIDQIKERYPTFSKEEEMRYNPDKPEIKEIQVHCKNHNCENSKEKGGWFTPIYSNLYERIRQIENENCNGGCYLYCSQHCKDTCPLYGSWGTDPFKEKVEQAYRSKVWSDQVLKQDSYECQICGSKENLHCHHIRPVKLEPEYALDPSNGIVLCQACHIKYGHKKGTECSHGNLAKIVCK